MRILLVVVLCAVAFPAAAQEVVSVGDLLLEPSVYDESEVTVVGELVGDYSERDQEMWVQLNDDDYVDAPVGEPGSRAISTNTGIGIRIPLGLFDQVLTDPPGRYGWRGPKVTVTGVSSISTPHWVVKPISTLPISVSSSRADPSRHLVQASPSS